MSSKGAVHHKTVAITEAVFSRHPDTREDTIQHMRVMCQNLDLVSVWQSAVRVR